MINLLKGIYRFISIPKKRIIFYKNRYFNFIFPNLFFISTKRVIYKNFPICNQKTLLTGVGHISIGKDCILGYKLGGFYRGGSIELQPRYKDAKIKIGDNVATNNNIFICAANLIEVKNNTRIGQNVTIMDFEAHGVDPNKRNKVGEIGKVIIDKNVWIGNNVMILKNSSIGENCIVAAGSVSFGNFSE